MTAETLRKQILLEGKKTRLKMQPTLNEEILADLGDWLKKPPIFVLAEKLFYFVPSTLIPTKFDYFLKSPFFFSKGI